MKHYFLGSSANFPRKDRRAQLFTHGAKKDSSALEEYLAKRYNSTSDQVALCKNGRSALSLAISSTLPENSKILVNAFTCYAVIEAIKSAKCTPVFADINPETLNFTKKTLEAAYESDIKAIIIQNTFGIPVEKAVFDFIKTKKLTLIEDLAHSAGTYYEDGSLAGTVGDATVLSFGKDKSIDTISGGALILHNNFILKTRPNKPLKFSELLRMRLYPSLMAFYRVLSYIHLETPYLALLLKIHLVERSADSPLDKTRHLPNFAAKIALRQIKRLKNDPIRTFALVKNRDEALKTLKKHGFYFNNFWYETPIAPKRYYKSVHFPEEKCPNAVQVSKSIINFPTYYSVKDLQKAHNLIKPFLIKEGE